MILVQSLEDRLALEIGAQVVERHRKEVELDTLRERVAQLEAAEQARAESANAHD